MTTTNSSIQKRFAARCIYNPGAATPIQGADANTSLVAQAPSLLQISAVEASTTAKVQSRVHESADWHDESTITGAAAAQIVIFAQRRNFVRVIRTAGTGNVVVYAQD